MSNIERVVSFLNEYSGHPYSAPLKVPDDETRHIMQRIFEVQKEAGKAFDGFVDEVGESANLIAIVHKGFLDGSCSRVRKYYWCEYRDEKYINSPESISLFVEVRNSDIQIRISTEINESKCSGQELANHNKLVDVVLPDGMSYALNNKSINDIYYTTDQSEAKSLLYTTYKKIQISKEISYTPQIADMLSSECSSIIKTITPIYLQLISRA